MNKRFSTILTMVLLLVGALFSNANAQLQAFPTGSEIKDGVKVYLATGNDLTNGALKVKTIDADNGIYTFDATKTVGDVSVFVIKDAKKELGVLTFKLTDVSGHVISVKKDGAAATSKTDAEATVFYVAKDKTLADADAIRVLNADAAKQLVVTDDPVYGYDVPGGGSAPFAVKFFAPATKEVTADELNANLSGQGFKLAFPNAVSEAEVNPFGVQIVAVTMEAYSNSSGFETGAENVPAGTYFAVAKGKEVNEAIQELAADQTAANQTALENAFKAATFIALDPNANFGITGFDVAGGEGYGFTTVKGDKLVDGNNVKKDGKININNAVFAVSEEDTQNAPGEYTITIATGAKVEGDESTDTQADVYVGAYSLTTGGIKTYITTVLASSKDKLSLAQTSSNTWAKASDLLKANDATIVTISFLGTKPADKDEAEKSLYGKYLVPAYGGSDFTAAVNAPKDVDVNNPLSQWVITDVTGREFTFTNRETGVTFKTSLYKTDKANEYVIGSEPTMAGASAITTVSGVTDNLETIANWKGQTVNLSATTASEGSLNLTDSQLEQASPMVFNGTGSVTVEKLYMVYDKDASSSPFFVPSNKADDAIMWLFEKGEVVKNKFKFAYLKDDEVAKADSVLNQMQSYLLYTKDNNNKKQYLAGVANNENYKDKADEAKRYYFKKNANGTYALIALDKTSKTTDAAKYTEVIKADAVRYTVDITTSKFATDKKLNEGTYGNVTLDFNSFTESLPAVARHATFDGEEGSVAMKVNKNGIMEGIVGADALTFWLDTADVDQEIPSFYISLGTPEVKAEEAAATRNFLFFAADSLTYWDAASATYKTNENYKLEGSVDDVKAIYRPATIAGIDTISTVVDGEAVLVAEKEKADVCLAGVKNFKFYIMKADESSYVIRPMGSSSNYLYNLNGKLGFTTDPDKALVVTLGKGTATSNEAISTVSTVKVIAGNGDIRILGAQGKKVVVSNVLGQSIANTVISSDDATISAPAGIVVVNVEGEAAVKAIVK